MKRLRYVFLIMFVLTTVFIFGNSAKPAVESSVQSGRFSDFLLQYFGKFFENEDTVVFFVRKAAHVTEFFLQSVCFSGVLFSEKYHKSIVYVLFVGLLTACTDEFIQLFFDGRAGMIKDVFIDFSGICLGVVSVIVLWAFLRKRKGAVA